MKNKTARLKTIPGHGYLGAANGWHYCSCGWAKPAGSATALRAEWGSHARRVAVDNARLNPPAVVAPCPVCYVKRATDNSWAEFVPCALHNGRK